MSDNVYISADKTKVVEEWTVGKKYQVPRAEAARLGLLDSAEKPVQQRRSPAPAHADKVGPTAPKQKRRSGKGK